MAKENLLCQKNNAYKLSKPWGRSFQFFLPRDMAKEGRATILMRWTKPDMAISEKGWILGLVPLRSANIITSPFAPEPSSPPRATPADLQAGSLLFLPPYDKRSSFPHLPQGFCRLLAHRRQCCFLDPCNYLHVGCIYWQLNGSMALRHQSPLNMLCARLLPAIAAGWEMLLPHYGAMCKGVSSWQSPQILEIPGKYASIPEERSLVLVKHESIQKSMQ